MHSTNTQKSIWILGASVLDEAQYNQAYKVMDQLHTINRDRYIIAVEYAVQCGGYTHGHIMQQKRFYIINRYMYHYWNSLNGPNISYAGMLDMSGLEWLPDRQFRLLDNFSKKAAEGPKYRRLFPCKELVFEEKIVRTSCLYNSPLYFMRRQLNQIYTPTT